MLVTLWIVLPQHEINAIAIRFIPISSLEGAESPLDTMCVIPCECFFMLLSLMEGSAKAGLNRDLAKETVMLMEVDVTVAV